MKLPPACPSVELFERALEGCSRALAADPGLTIGPSARPAGASAAVSRGRCDALAGRARYHDPSLHRSLAPPGPVSRAVFDALEDLRVEALAARRMRGVADNLAAAFNHRYGSRGLNLLDSDGATPLANAVVLMAREQLLGRPLPEAAASLVATWRDVVAGLSGRPARRNLADLQAAVGDQSAFARRALRFIASLEWVDDPQQGPHGGADDAAGDDRAAAAQAGPSAAGDGEETAEEGGEAPGHDRAERQGAVDASASGERAAGADAAGTVIPFPDAHRGEAREGAQDATEGPPQEPGEGPRERRSPAAYRAYTTRFDQVVAARELVDPGLGLLLRRQLDREISQHRRLAARLAKRLHNSLSVLQNRAWTFDLDDGLLDTARLARLVADPSSPLVFRQERSAQTRDTLVSFLIDNSGSMRGRPITLAAMFTDILAQTLERCHVATEILGFTTREWRGGQAGRRWRANGQPGQPGRLSDLRHVIYKTADEPWRRARQYLGVMLWPELLKENIDGEALLWAHGRLCGRPEARRILVVVSDGVPADDTTLGANARDYLEAHLKQVVVWIGSRSSVEMLAIGIGHDVGAIYPRSVTIQDSEQLGDAMAHELIELLGNVPVTARYPLAINH